MGGLGVIQPVTLTYVYEYDFKEAFSYIRTLTSKPLGMNVLIKESSKKYHEKMRKWIEIVLDEGVGFFITSLGKPELVVNMVHSRGGIVYHDATELKWAKIAVVSGVDGLICVNNRAGGHAGEKSAKELYEELSSLDLPLVCAGGKGDKNEFSQVLKIGYSAVQMGTRFIASSECMAPQTYKNAIINSGEKDIILTKNITGVPVSVINNKYIKKLGIKPGFIVGWMLSNNTLKHFVRLMFTLKSLVTLKSAIKDGKKEFFQAGKSVETIKEVLPVKKIIENFVKNTDAKGV